MRFAFSVSTVVCLALSAAYAEPNAAAPVLSSAPLRFEPATSNEGPGFIARGLRYRFSFTSNSAILRESGKTVQLTFAGASSDARMEGIDKLRSTTGVFHGSDPAKWRPSIPNYGRLQVPGLYPGIDLVYYGNGRELEYDLIVRAASDPKQVRLKFSGGRTYIDRNGALAGGFLQKRPTAYQVAGNGTRVPVECRYRRNSDGTFGFGLGHYDKTRDVIIDPVLTLSTYFGGSNQDVGTAIGHDSLGYIYVAGTGESVDLTSYGVPVANGLSGSSDLFVARIDPHVTPDRQLVYMVYFGGGGDETVNEMFVTPGGSVYLTGITSSTDFPISNGSQTTISGTSDAFVMWLDFTKNPLLSYSTYLGGTGDDVGTGITTDSKGRIFIAGTTRSKDFPVNGGFQSTNGSAQTAFIAGFDPAQSGSSSFIYSTYLGGAGGESARGIAAAADGTLWVVGSTYSGDFPVTGVSYQPSYHPGGDGFVAQINPTAGAALPYATFLGGSGPDEAKSVVIDQSGRIVVSGYTGSQDFPVTGAAALQPLYGGNFDAFVTILDPRVTTSRESQLIYSTFCGGNQADIPYDLKVDPDGNLYLTGFTQSPDFPVSGNALQRVFSPVTMAGFVLKFNPVRPSLASVGYSSYIISSGRQIGYGVDYDVNGRIYVTGYTTGPLFDSFGGARRSTSQGNTDAFLLGVNTCSYALTPGSLTFPPQGGSATVTLTPSTPDCSWTASTPVDWITLSQTSGTGAGSISITAAANTGASRTATLTIAGVPFIVNQ